MSSGPLTATSAVDAAIREATGFTGEACETVWVYGRALWCYLGRMEFQPEGSAKAVTIATRLIKRYRDGDSSCFLVEMPRHMASTLEIEGCVLDGEDLKRKFSVIDTSREF